MRRKRYVAPVVDLPTVLVILRTVRGLGQTELAKITGLSAGLISDYERGKIAPSLGSLQRVLSGLGWELSDLDTTQAFIDRVRNQQWDAFPAEPLPGGSGPRSNEIAQAADAAGRLATRTLQLFFKILSRRAGDE